MIEKGKALIGRVNLMTDKTDIETPHTTLAAAMLHYFRIKHRREPITLRNPFTGEVFWVECFYDM